MWREQPARTLSRTIGPSGTFEIPRTDPRLDQSKMSTSFELEVERAVLPNGLTILVSSNKSVPSVSINAVVRTGARFESEDQAGLASITGEMIDEGTINRDSQAIAGAIEAVGGRLGTFGDYQISGAAMLLL